MDDAPLIRSPGASLTGIEWTRLNEFILRIHRQTTEQGIIDLVVTELPAMIDVDWVGWNVIRVRWPYMPSFHTTEDWLQAATDMAPFTNATLMSHPMIDVLGILNEEPTYMTRVYTVDEFMTDREFRETAIYRESYRHLETEYQMATHFQHAGDTGIVLSANSRHPITARGRVTLDILREHFCVVCSRIFHDEASIERLADRLGQVPSAWRESLTRRQVEVADLMLRGLRNADIAQRLGISQRTVEKHVEHVLYKLRMDSRRDMILAAQRVRRHSLS